MFFTKKQIINAGTFFPVSFRLAFKIYFYKYILFLSTAKVLKQGYWSFNQSNKRIIIFKM